MKRTAIIISILSFLIISCQANAAKLVTVKVIDKDYLMVNFKDGDVCFVDDGLGSTAFTGNHDTANNYRVNYGTALNLTNAIANASWVLKSTTDVNYGTSGQNPSNSYRKSKLNGMAEMDWSGSDYIYDYTMEHTIYLRLPYSMVQGTAYTLEINSNTNSDVLSNTFTYDIFNSPTESIHVNLVGYINDNSVKPVDLYMWMGDCGARDYSSFVGKKVYIYDVCSLVSQQVGTVAFWKNSGSDAGGYNYTASNVWTADFNGLFTPGTYRVAIDGVGCSVDFEIRGDIYYEPFKVNTLGYFYQRMGQDSNYAHMPVPRKPLYIPGVSPSTTKVWITTMSPLNPNWGTFSGGDVWDNPTAWAAYKKTGNPVNNNAYGGHSDAADWDRHLGHISDIYDMLLPFILADGRLLDDDLQIAESGNGIPDIIDEARNEVDFWLRLKDGDGYGYGVTNPDGSNNLYQAGTMPICAWANAANASMLANCFMLADLPDLANTYRDAAVTAYNYGCSLPDQMLGSSQNIGDYSVRGIDLKMMTAAFLYNVTGDTAYEDMLNSLCDITSDTSTIISLGKYELWACAGYLKTKRTVHYPTLFSRMKNSIINEAKSAETNNINNRPSRRATDSQMGYWRTANNVQRTMVAHAVTTNSADKGLFENALILEADWSLGRNPMNIIYMTTACTNLGNKRSLENAYNTGRDDGYPGVHPGWTPYLQTEDWATMIMGKPSWMTDKCYPAYSGWPVAESYFNSRYVWANGECCPRQTMRGKQSLYSYLYGFNNMDPPAAPAGLSIGAGNGVIAINWTDNNEGDFNGYNVFRAEVSGGPYTRQNSSLIKDSNYTDTSVVNGTTYYYIVTAIDMTAVESDNSAEVSATPYVDTIAPAVPSGLSATPALSTVSLNWNDNGEDDLYGYNIYRSTVSGGPYTKQNNAKVSSSDYVDNDVVNGTTYYYVVTAVDISTNESDYSNQVWAVPSDQPPAVPTGLSAVASNERVVLNWNDNGEIDFAGYNLYRSTTSGSGYTRINGSLLSSSNYTDDSVANDTIYYYVVTAVDSGTNESGYSSEVSTFPELRAEILGTWISGTSHTKEIGTNRALIFIAHAEYGATILNSVTYGGQTMTKVIDVNVGTSSRAHVAAFILNEAGVLAATNGNFVVSWSTSPGTAVAYSSVFLKNVDQANMVGSKDSNVAASSTPNPIKTNPLSASDGDIVFVAATCGNAGSYTLPGDYNEGTDQAVGSSAQGVAGHKIVRNTTETPSATHNNVNRQVIIGFVVNAMPTGYAHCSDVIAAGYKLPADIFDTGDCYVNLYDLDAFINRWLDGTCTGPDNCHGADFAPADGVVNLFDLSDFASQWKACNDPENPLCSQNW